MLEIELNEALKDYDEVLEEFTPKTICLVEGNNKYFYQQIKELYPYIVDNGGDCAKIISEVGKSGGQKIGIIDNDYRDKNKHFKNIIKIDYYSIENIVLEKISDFQILVNELIKESNSLGLEKLKKHNIEVEFSPEILDNSEFKLKLKKEYEDVTRLQYVESEVTDICSLIKYKNLKKAVEGTTTFLKIKSHIRIEYLYKLHEYIENKSIKYILSQDEYNRFLSIDKSIK